jgi:hypothetical protein
MQPYKGYFMEGSALLVHPFSPDWHVGGSVLSGYSGSILGITRFQLHQFTVSIKELAEWFWAGGCAARGGRVPASTRELNGEVPPTRCPHETATWESWSPERKTKIPVQAINGHCLQCGYRLVWILIRGRHLRIVGRRDLILVTEQHPKTSQFGCIPGFGLPGHSCEENLVPLFFVVKPMEV